MKGRRRVERRRVENLGLSLAAIVGAIVVALAARGRRLTLLTFLVALSLCLGPAAASAATRYAAPGAAGAEPCIQAAPCGIATAVGGGGAVDGDEILLEDGNYNLGGTSLTLNDASYLHAAPGAHPVITGSASFVLMVDNIGAHVSDIEVSHSGSLSGLIEFAGVVERVRVTSSGSLGGCGAYGGVLRDSVCRGTSGPGVSIASGGVGTNSATLRNLTIIGATNGIQVDVNGGSEFDFDIKNTIIIGVGTDISAATDSDGVSRVTIVLTNSSYDNTTTLGTRTSITSVGTANNLTSAPIFLSAFGGDYHQASNSPTINAGIVDGSVGALDFDGDARNQGGAPDIGADEVAETSPQTTISAKPAKKTHRRKARFKFASSESASTFECKIDNRAFEACSSPKKYRGLRRKAHTFRVRATDALGNVDATPAKWRWRVRR